MHINKYAPTIELLVRKSFQIKRYTMMYVSSFQNIFLSTEKQAYQSASFVLYLLLKYPAMDLYM